MICRNSKAVDSETQRKITWIPDYLMYMGRECNRTLFATSSLIVNLFTFLIRLLCMFYCFMRVCVCVSVCLRVRDCCECFVFKYTHALTVLNGKFSILLEAGPRAFVPDKTLLHLVFLNITSFT